ncbi:MAG: hypothetical protein IJ849_02445 [Selenomonadaceae bacterium]|nr:hypothetical protein [Selenomonadaceae bacterium]
MSKLNAWIEKRQKLCFTLVFILLVGAYLGYDRSFQADSETLVTGPIRAEIESAVKGNYNLGRYLGIAGIMQDYRDTRYAEDWDKGYSAKEPAIAISNNEFTRELLEKAVALVDIQGQRYEIIGYHIVANLTRLDVKSETPLNAAQNGEIAELKFIDKDGNYLPTIKIRDYKSQYGMQGQVFTTLAQPMAKYLNWKQIRNIFRSVCLVALAVVLTLICYYVGRKYNWGLALCYWLTFLTSPWIINFAPNLYWVEFTWFIPMLIGLVASLHSESFSGRLLAYGLMMVAIGIKCLCGYEYVSTIILGAALFPLVDVAARWRQGDKRLVVNSGKLAIGLCLAGVMGFVLAITLHGFYRGEGDIMLGLSDIYEHDVLRRTWGGDPHNFSNSITVASLQASALSVLAKYFILKTSIALDIPGVLFPFLAVAPLIIWHYRKRHRQTQMWGTEIFALYGLSFIATVSWLTLAKAHSYVHTHMNYVLWYFGFVQVCLYCLLIWLKEVAGKLRTEKEL